ncbi:hypothetical protein JCM3766R1_001988 [Sporobolomyces carnicolor]
MAIAPIQGMLRRSVASLSHSSVTFPNHNSLLSSRQILFNISIGTGSGLVGGYTFWYGFHEKNVKIRDAYYLSLAEQKRAEGM